MEINTAGLKGFFKKGAPFEVSSAKVHPDLHTTLGLKEFLARLESKGRVHLLDLGPAVEETILYLARRNCKVYVQDFFFELKQARLEHPPDQDFSFARFLDASFPYANNTFDAVLAWDLFNYLPPKDGNFLARKLFTQMKIGGLLLGFFFSTQTIPSEPVGCRIVDAGHLQYEIQSLDQINASSLTNNEIVKMMDRFAVVNFYFLRNGVREALLAKK